jgi:glutamate dehydrogenase (NAD(P)+)
MRIAFQQIHERYWAEKKVGSYRVAAMAIAIEKIYNSYRMMGIYP